MSYLIRTTDGTLIAEVQEQSANSTATPLTLIGRAYLNYGEALNDNLLRLMDNFAHVIPPAPAFTGMLWYDKGHDVLNVRQTNGTFSPIATQQWASGQFVSTAAFNTAGYATQSYVAANYESLADLNQRNLASQPWVLSQGFLTRNQTITLGGDVTGTGTTSITVALAPNGVVSGTYQKVVVDTKGRVSQGGLLTQQDIIGALGYTPEAANGSSGISATFTFGALDSSPGAILNMVEMDSTNTNSSRLVFSQRRFKAGSNWQSASTRLQLITDTTAQGYLEFNSGTHAGGFTLGANNNAGNVLALISSIPSTVTASGMGVLVNGPMFVGQEIYLQSNANTNLYFTDTAGNKHGALWWDNSVGAIKLSARSDATQPVIVNADGSIQANAFVLNDQGGGPDTGMYNPRDGRMEFHTNGVTRFVIDANEPGNAWSHSSYFGPPTSNGPGSWQWTLQNNGYVALASITPAVSLFNIDPQGNLYAAGNLATGASGSIYGNYLTARKGALSLNALDYVRNGSGQVVGQTGNYVQMNDPQGYQNAQFWYDGLGNMYWSTLPQRNAQNAVTGWSNTMRLGQDGGLYLYGTGSMVAPRFFMRDTNASGQDSPDTGMTQGSDNDLQLYSGGVMRMQIDPSGNSHMFFGPGDVGPNHHNQSLPYHQWTWQSDRNVVLYSAVFDGNGNAVQDSNGGQVMYGYWATNTGTSDARLKENVLDLDDGLMVINRLRPVSFTWKHDSGLWDDGVVHIGFLAQDVAREIPDAVVKVTHEQSGNDTMLLHKQEIVPHLVRAVQQLTTERDLLAHRVEMMEQKLALLLDALPKS